MKDGIHVPASEVSEEMIVQAGKLLALAAPPLGSDEDGPAERIKQFYVVIRAIMIAYRDATPEHTAEMRNNVYLYSFVSCMGGMVAIMKRETWDTALRHMTNDVRTVAQRFWAHGLQ